MRDALLWAVVLWALASATVYRAAKADTWDHTDYALMTADVVTRLADAYQTSQIQDHDDIEEVDIIGRPVMGRNPSNGAVVGYFAAMIGLDVAIANALPSTWRKVYLSGRTALNIKVVHDNAQLGLKWRW